MSGFANDAEKLFLDFAERNCLLIEKITQNNVELMMSVPRQDGLVFELTLGLQNYDEINIGFCGFWSYIFPFKENYEFIAKLLDDLIVGKTRLAIHEQFGRVVFRDLEQIIDGCWSRVYREHCKVRVPFMRTDISYIVNEQA